MAVSQDQFLTWLGEVQHANADAVVHVNEFGKYSPQVLYVGRAMRSENPTVGRFGNPFYEREHGRIGCIKRYVGYLMRKPKPELLALLLDIRIALDEGRKLACWCAPNVCHAHVLAGWARKLNLTETMHELSSGTPGTTGQRAPQTDAGTPAGTVQRAPQSSPEAPLLPTDSPPCATDPEPVEKGPRFARSA